MKHVTRVKASRWFLCDDCSRTIRAGEHYMEVREGDSLYLYHQGCYKKQKEPSSCA